MTGIWQPLGNVSGQHKENAHAALAKPNPGLGLGGNLLREAT